MCLPKRVKIIKETISLELKYKKNSLSENYYLFKANNATITAFYVKDIWNKNIFIIYNLKKYILNVYIIFQKKRI